MWLAFALVSALFLGLYDVAKKQSLKENAVIPVLWFNTLFCSLLMLPFTLLSAKTGLLDGSIFYVPTAGWELHRLLMLKAFIVLGSWIFGYFGMKHLPITLFGPINATRPIIVLLGGLLDNETHFRQCVISLLKQNNPDIQIVKPLHNAAEGALLEAKALGR